MFWVNYGSPMIDERLIGCQLIFVGPRQSFGITKVRWLVAKQRSPE